MMSRREKRRKRRGAWELIQLLGSAPDLPPSNLPSNSLSIDIKKRLKRDSITYLLGKLIPAGIGVISVSIFIRLIGTEEYGKFALLLSIVLLVSNMASGWICQGILRFSSDYQSDEDKATFRTVVSWSSLISIVVGVSAVSSAAFWFMNSPWKVTLIGVMVFISFFSYSVRVTIQQAELNAPSVLWAEAVRAVTTLAVPLLLFFMLKNKGYILLMCGTLAGYIMGLIALRKGPLLSLKSNAVTDMIMMGRIIWNYGWPLAIWFAFAYLLNVSDRYLIKYFVDYNAVGIYSAIYDIVYKSFSLLLLPVTIAAHPLITSQWNSGDKAGTPTLLKEAIKYQLLIFLFVISVFYFSSALLVRLILGVDDPVAAGLVVPVAIGSFLWQIAMLIHKPMELLYQTKRMLVFVGIALAVNIVGNIVLIPVYGYPVAAYTTIAGSLVYLLLVVVTTIRRLDCLTDLESTS